MVLIKMQDNKAHPLLAQIPLTVSPFIQLPSAITLPYTYKTLPSTLPPSSVPPSSGADEKKPKFVTSASGHAEHPDDILASCKALHAYIDEVKEDAEKEIREWEDGIKTRELAEKRRVAPGWLDSESHLLMPSKKDGRVGNGVGGAMSNWNEKGNEGSLMDSDASNGEASKLGESLSEQVEREGEQMDRVFGGLASS